jgi:hypothetical protein
MRAPLKPKNGSGGGTSDMSKIFGELSTMSKIELTDINNKPAITEGVEDLVPLFPHLPKVILEIAVIIRGIHHPNSRVNSYDVRAAEVIYDKYIKPTDQGTSSTPTTVLTFG